MFRFASVFAKYKFKKTNAVFSYMEKCYKKGETVRKRNWIKSTFLTVFEEQVGEDTLQ